MFLTFLRTTVPVLLILISFIILFLLILKKKRSALRIIGQILLIAIITVNALYLALPGLKYLAPIRLTSNPVVIDGGDSYSIIWSTNVYGSAKVDITAKDGKTYSFTDATDGIGSFSTVFHRVDVEKDILEGATYNVSSKKTLNNTFYGYKLGKEAKSDNFNFKEVNTSENISFFTISDVQGGERPARKVIDMVKDENYDFVLLLGDYSNQYNKVNDIVKPLLQLAAQASKSQIPCLYVAGNHEIKGSMSKELNDLFPTPSPTNERYFTYNYGQLFITGLNFGDDHSDLDPRYNGVSEFNAYKDKEYEWLKDVAAAKEYQNYKYNLGIVHIPIIFNEDTLASDDCDECHDSHGYKMNEFASTLNDMNIQLLVSAHTHDTRLVRHKDLSFPNFHTGGVTGGLLKKYYKNSLISLSNGKIEFATYYDNGDIIKNSIEI